MSLTVMGFYHSTENHGPPRPPWTTWKERKITKYHDIFWVHLASLNALRGQKWLHVTIEPKKLTFPPVFAISLHINAQTLSLAKYHYKNVDYYMCQPLGGWRGLIWMITSDRWCLMVPPCPYFLVFWQVREVRCFPANDRSHFCGLRHICKFLFWP